MRLLPVAVAQHGMFLVEQAVEAGVGAAQVRGMAARGVLERRAQGVYRISSMPLTEHTEFMEAVLWARGRGTIAGDSALLLHDLADVNPRKIRIAVPRNYVPRKQHGELYVVVTETLTPDEVDEAEGIPVAAPKVAIRQAIDQGLGADLIEQAIARAQARELIGTETAARLRVALYDRSKKR